jgi:uncharacterized repeat protein (TIGR03843 family)
VVPVTAQMLTEAPMKILGQLQGASNGTFLVELNDDEDALAVYKPVVGERPLWDFPEGTLSGREVAVWAVDHALGFNLVPLTVWREEGQLGAGMCQQWIVEDESQALVDVVPRGESLTGWRTVLRARDEENAVVELIHSEHDRLRDLALLDAVVNNADRKAGHIIVDLNGKVFGIDHGIALHSENKLRTVLWGWAGEALTERHLDALMKLQHQLTEGVEPIDRWLNGHERRALRSRVEDLVSTRTYPLPSAQWPSIPWPVF